MLLQASASFRDALHCCQGGETSNCGNALSCRNRCFTLMSLRRGEQEWVKQTFSILKLLLQRFWVVSIIIPNF